MASITALGIPEIVTHVVKMTESRAELARCCRVNRVWHDSAISHLWEVAPSCSTLVELHRQDVVRKYLPHIKKQAIVVDDMKSMAERRFRYVLARGVLARIQIVALSLALPPSFPLNANVTNVLGSSLRILQLPKSWYGEKVFTWVEVSIYALLFESDWIHDASRILPARLVL